MRNRKTSARSLPAASRSNRASGRVQALPQPELVAGRARGRHDAQPSA